jgi:hypothetical protein
MSANILVQYGAETISPSSIIFRSDNAPAINAPPEEIQDSSFGKDLAKWFDLDAIEYSAGRIRITMSEFECGGFAVHVDDDETTRAVEEWARDHEFTLSVEGPQVLDVRGADLGSEGCAVGAVVADYHVEHRELLPFREI